MCDNDKPRRYVRVPLKKGFGMILMKSGSRLCIAEPPRWNIVEGSWRTRPSWTSALVPAVERSSPTTRYVHAHNLSFSSVGRWFLFRHSKSPLAYHGAEEKDECFARDS